MNWTKTDNQCHWNSSRVPTGITRRTSISAPLYLSTNQHITYRTRYSNTYIFSRVTSKSLVVVGPRRVCGCLPTVSKYIGQYTVLKIALRLRHVRPKKFWNKSNGFAPPPPWPLSCWRTPSYKTITYWSTESRKVNEVAYFAMSVIYFPFLVIASDITFDANYHHLPTSGSDSTS